MRPLHIASLSVQCITSLRLLRVVIVGDLAPSLTALLGPREVRHRDEEKAVATVEDTRHGIVPGGESSQDTESATGPEEFCVGLGHRAHTVKIGNRQSEECQIEREEKEEEGDGGPQRTEQHQEREDEPALNTGVSVILRRAAYTWRLTYEEVE